MAFLHKKSIPRGQSQRLTAPDGFSYSSRNQNLLNLGFPDYAAYLASDLYRGIRRRVLADRNHQCVCCGQEATQVHHERYTVADLLGETIDFLQAICVRCHEDVERDGKHKRPMSSACRRLQQLIGLRRGTWVPHWQGAGKGRSRRGHRLRLKERREASDVDYAEE